VGGLVIYLRLQLWFIYACGGVLFIPAVAASLDVADLSL